MCPSFRGSHRRHRLWFCAAHGRRHRIVEGRARRQLIWASPRELLNIFQADATGCHIITVTNDILAKLQLVGKDLDDYSLDTVNIFYNDTRTTGFWL